MRAYQLLPTQEEKQEKFPDFYIQRDVDRLTDEYKPAVKMLLDYSDFDHEADSQIQIRVYGQNTPEERFLHAKCYIVYQYDENGDFSSAYGIIGSSNFTKKGLQDQDELDYLETNPQIVASESPLGKYQTHRLWFKKKWEQGEPWTGKFIQEILKPSRIGTAVEKDKEKEGPKVLALTPYEVYIKYLQLQFGDMIDAGISEVLKSYLPPSFRPLEYQLDAVKQCFSVMKRFGGFILGDVVGLGKTVVGVMLIRYFLENAESLGREPKVLIVTPPAIKSAWVKTIDDFDKENPSNHIAACVDFVTTGSIGKLTADIDDIDVDLQDDTATIEGLKTTEAYGLILVDESHNFRNSDTQKYRAIDDLIGEIAPTPYVALLSATPQNNSPQDLYNQIRLFQRDPNNSTLPNVEAGKLDSFFAEIRRRFAAARAIPQDEEQGKLKAKEAIRKISEEVRRCVLNDLVVRRTRTDIRNIYGEDAQLLKFPGIKGPIKLEYKMDEELQRLFFDTVEAICPPLSDECFDPRKHIGFYRYAAITQFVDPANTKLYEKRNLTVDSITARLKHIMQILLVKRLESSITAFKATIENLKRYNRVMIDMLTHDCVFICPDIDINKLHAEHAGDFETFKKAANEAIAKKGGNNRCFSASDFKPTYLQDLLNDDRLIDSLISRWNLNSEDPKFDRFKEAINDDLFEPTINNPSGHNKRRLVIFTEAIDTLNSLKRALERKGHHVLCITAQNRDQMQPTIAANFDANCSPSMQRDDYDVIITTDVLAEGVNLHRANVLLNFDAPWNATRLMQRIGRVNRIGSTEEFVHVFNFFPSAEGNSQIRLIETAFAKLQSFHEMFGEDSKVFNPLEELVEHQLPALVEGEESPFGPYINELKAYRNASPERYALLASITPEGQGGMLEAEVAPKRGIFIFTNDSKELIPVEVKIDTESPQGRVVSSLKAMQELKCTPEAAYAAHILDDTKLDEVALRAYNTHVARYFTASDSSRRISKALEIISRLRAREDVKIETKKFLRKIGELVRANDSDAIKQVMKFDNLDPSLFGADFDINSLITSTLERLAARAEKRRGKARLALYTIK